MFLNLDKNASKLTEIAHSGLMFRVAGDGEVLKGDEKALKTMENR